MSEITKGLTILFVLTLGLMAFVNIPNVENYISAAMYSGNLGTGPIVPDIKNELEFNVDTEIPIIVTCNDSDGGKNYYTQGTTKYGSVIKTDNCNSNTELVEYYCSGDAVKSEKKTLSGYACESGALVKAQIKEINNNINTNIEIKICSDTDNGFDTTTFGKATYDGKTYSDECSSESQLIEYYCKTDKSGVSYSVTSCGTDYYCASGKCVAKRCSDSDGKDLTTKGKTITEIDTKYDTCSGEDVFEYYCDGTTRRGTVYSCPDNYKCDDGKCILKIKEINIGEIEIPPIKIATCEDTDGKNAYEYGSVKNGNYTLSDSCLSDVIVTERYCSNNSIKSENIPCGDGYVCNSGKCIEKNDNSVGEKCVDSDRGKDIYNRGIVKDELGNEWKDSCSGTAGKNSVDEFYCLNNEINKETLFCPDNYYCSYGECIARNTSTTLREYCNEYDGYIITDSGKFYNECFMTNMLAKYSCKSNTMQLYEQIYCPYGCKNGECINSNIDETENNSPPSLEEVEGEEIKTISISVKKGWNLLPVVPYDKTSSYKLIEDNCVDDNIIWNYNSNKKAYENIKVSGLISGKSFWYYSNENCNYLKYEKLEGYGAPKISFVSGWNFFSVGEEKSISDLNNCDIVRGPYKFDATKNTYVKVTKMIPEEGYIIKVMSTCEVN